MLAMSYQAYTAFTEEHMTLLKKHFQILASEVSELEYVGGGSCRCLLAEIY